MKELVIEPSEWKSDQVSTSVTLTERTLDARVHAVTFEASEDVGRETDFLLPLTLLPAMVTGSRLKLPGRLSPRLLSTMPKIQDVYCQWADEFAFFGPRRVAVDGEVGSKKVSRASGVACFFSGGVDSFYTLLKNLHEITHLIFVHGIDIPLGNSALRAQASHAAREVAKETGKSLIEVTTDLRSFSDPLVHWVQYQGAALASVGLLFQHLFHKVLIPATFSYADLPPWGSHPLLDPLWSTEVTDFEHDGAEATRVDKAAYISRHETAMRWLRVCWIAYSSHLYDYGWITSTNRPYNCGRCGKCLTTMVNLRAAGTLERCETLPHTIDPKDIMKIDRARPDDLVMARQNIKALERAGGDPELVRALKRSIQPTALYPRRRYQVANVLTGAKPLEVSGVRGLVRRHRGIRLREISDPEEWNATVKSLGGSIAQSWEWGVFHEPEGWNPLRLVDEEGRAAVQLLVFERRGGFSVAHAPYGPLAGDAADLPRLVDSIALRARECRACLLGFEPRWGPEAGREVLGVDGYANARRSLPGSTIIVDIPQDPEEHLGVLPKDTRSGILRARHQGVEVETVTGNSVEKKGMQEFVNLLEGSSMRQGFTLAPANYYWRLLIVLPARLLLARHEGRVVAGALIAAFGDEAYYLYGAFRSRESLLALDLVQWEAMDFARKMGCSRYDMWGMPYRPYPDYWAWGYDPSKERFGGAPIEYVEPSSRILSKPQFWEQRAISLGVEGYHAWRKRHGRTSGR